MSVPCQVVKNAGPGRPSVNIPPEVLEELRVLCFEWQNIASIFGVSRWTIVRRVRLFELEHLSLFSSITKEHHHLFSSITRDELNEYEPIELNEYEPIKLKEFWSIN